MSFLSQDNASYIMGILKSFMADKYEFDVRKIPEGEYLRMIGETMTRVNRVHGKQCDMGGLNKMTLSELKETIKGRFLGGSVQGPGVVLVSPSQPAQPAMPTPPPTQSLAQSLAPPPTFLDADGSEDSDFFNKLQKLEFQRKTGTGPVQALGVAPADMVYTNNVQATTSPAPAPVPTSPIIYVPPSFRVGKELAIHSWNRNWIEESNRNGFTWKGPLPRQMDRMNTRVGCFIGPVDFLRETSILSLRIEGANQDEVYVSLIPHHTVGNYVIYRPVLESLSYIRLLALPWKIYIESSDGEELYIGEDNVPFALLSVSSETSTIRTKLTAREGDSLRLYSWASKRTFPVRVLRVGGEEGVLEVTGKIDGNGVALSFPGQFSIVFELVSSEHRE